MQRERVLLVDSLNERAMQRICILLSLLMAASPMPAWAAKKHTQARYPTQLHGMWIPEAATCPAPGESFDGDMVMNIGPRLMQGYEDQRKPVSVIRISSKPMTWRIESLLDVGPSGVYGKDLPAVFVLGKERVTVATEERAETYKRCVRRER